MTQRTILNSARAAGARNAGIQLSLGLTDEQCNYLLLLIADDLGIRDQLSTPGPETIDAFFSDLDPTDLLVTGIDVESLFAELLALVPDADTYFHCLSSLHKRRLKFTRILKYQAIPTIRQVGPRGLLQYGSVSDHALTAFLFWRKWLYDIDNRAAQETGFIFEPIVARCIGGMPCSSRESPIRRTADTSKGRQVDCLIDKLAYEIKLRITVAASGQGRWSEEKSFPVDCRESGYVPILLVFDDTQAGKLDELMAIFIENGGQAHIGDAAWQHLEEQAGPTIAIFLEKYVRGPLAQLLASAPNREALPDMVVKQRDGSITVQIGDEQFVFERPIRENMLEEDDDGED